MRTMELRNLNLPIFLPSGDDALRSIARVQDALRAMHGVEDASVNNARDLLRVVFDPERLTASRIEQEARRAGIDIALHIDHATLALLSLDGPETAQQMVRILRRMAGVLWAGIDFPSAVLHLEWDRSVVDLEIVRARLKRLGIVSRLLWRSDTEIEPELNTLNAVPAVSPAHIQRWVGSVVAAAVGGIALSSAGTSGTTLYKILCLLSILLSGWDSFASGARLLRVRGAGHYLPLLLLLAGTLALGWFGTAAIASLVMASAGLFRDLWLGGERKRIWAFLAEMPTRATVQREDVEQQVPISEVRVGERVMVGKGQTIPLDGTILHGSGMIDAGMLFGGDNRYEAATGFAVFAGSRSDADELEIRVLRHYRDTPLVFARHAFAEALTQGAPAHKQTEARLEKFRLMLLWAAVFVAFVPPFLTEHRTAATLPFWVMRGLAIAATAWSSSILLSGATGRMAAAFEAAQRGVVLRMGGIWETLSQVKALVHSRTGVLTEGRLHVTDVVPCGKLTAAEILSLAASLETYSTHPVAKAICHEARQHSVESTFEVTAYEAVSGHGVSGVVNGLPVFVGSPRWMREERFALPRVIVEAMTEADKLGLTPVLVAGQNTLHGVMMLRDTPSPVAGKMVQALREAGVFMQMVLSGDTPRATETVAKSASIAEFESEQTPDEKARWMDTLRKQYGIVAFVGDGDADRGAMRRADISLAMRAAENALGLEAADISILHADVATLPFLRRQAQNVQKTAKSTFVLIVTLKVLALASVLAFGIPLWVIFAAEALSLLFAVRMGLSLSSPAAASHPAAASKTEKAAMEETEALFDLVFVHDPAADPEPVPGYAYPRWQSFVVPFTGEPIRFGRVSEKSTLPLQVTDEGMSRLHGEIRMENRRPVVVDLRSTNGIRRNGRTSEALIPPEKPIPLRFGDVLMIGRNTRIEVRPPGEAAQQTPQAAVASSSSPMEQTGTPIR